MDIKTSEFVMSNTDYNKCPNENRQEFAFIGRSNVGKSSLINMLCRKKGLAKTSSTPGKTLLINHFIINNEWYLVDLPGYGYARISKTMREKLRKIIESYLLFRTQLTNVFLLIDSRHEPQDADVEFMEWLGENSIPFSIVFTKGDKFKTEGKLKIAIENYKEKLLENWEELPPYFVTSSEKHVGKEAILDYMEQILHNT